MGLGGGGGDGARVSIFFLLTKNPIFYGRGWGTVSDFFKITKLRKRRG